MDWLYDMVMTWGHIIVGLSFLSMAYVCTWAIVSWFRSIDRQIERDRKLSGRPPEPWRYQ